LVFSSVIFIFYFLPIFLVLYYFFGAKNMPLLLGSAVFYAWGEGLLLLLLAAMVVLNFYLGQAIASAAPERRQRLVAAGIVIDLLVLAFFKYLGFLTETAHAVTGLALPKVDIHLPLGISFFTFQLISYLIDIGRGSLVGDRNLTRFATYVMMFPHLIAGPIVRYSDIDKELAKRTINLDWIGLGVQYFIVGLCQKVLIANVVATAADKVFGFPATELTPLVAWIGVLAYSLQIYFDFCGYSNMAIGLAFILGFRFPRNFDYPYMSRSITEFWRRWHVSLSFWFRDYVYLSLGGNRLGALKTTRNLLIVFFLTGLWHGASWTFVLWGLFHGSFLLIERAFLRQALDKWPAWIGHVYALLVVMVGWVLFRADSLQHAGHILSAMFGVGAKNPLEPLQLLLTPEITLALVIGSLVCFPVLPRLFGMLGSPEVDGPVVPGTAHADVTRVHVIPVPLLLAGFCLSIIMLISSSLNPFLYFRF
jgi:alginate O-acetyltransferase complex protein AlgI